MPKRHPEVFGRPLLHFTPIKLKYENLAGEYLNSISYRQKQSPLNQFVSQSALDEGKSSSLSVIGKIVEEGRNAGFENETLWEYIHLVNLGRHYSTLMGKSLRPTLTVIIPALTNSNYDLAFNLPTEYKRNWTVYRLALNRMAPDLMSVLNSNTHLRASIPLQVQSLIKLIRGGTNLITSGKPGVSIEYSERSWPRTRDAYRDGTVIESRVHKMISQGKVMDAGFLNVDRVRRAYEETKTGISDHSILIGQLLTLEYGVFQDL